MSASGINRCPYNWREWRGHGGQGGGYALEGVPVLKLRLLNSHPARNGTNSEPPIGHLTSGRPNSHLVTSNYFGFLPPRKGQIYLDWKWLILKVWVCPFCPEGFGQLPSPIPSPSMCSSTQPGLCLILHRMKVPISEQRRCSPFLHLQSTSF